MRRQVTSSMRPKEGAEELELREALEMVSENSARLRGSDSAAATSSSACWLTPPRCRGSEGAWL